MCRKSGLKKRCFTLIEVVVALGLLSLLLGSLFFFYSHLTQRKGQLEKEKGTLLEERFFIERLEKILKKATLPFFASKERCVFMFDRGLYKEPRLSGKVLAELYYDVSQKKLQLALWPGPRSDSVLRRPCEVHTLLDNVEKVKIEYYFPPIVLKQDVDPSVIGKIHPKEDVWQNSWDLRYKVLPALIKLNLTRNSEETEYIFDLSVPILYPQGKIEK